MKSKEDIRSWIALVAISFTDFFDYGVVKSFGVILPVLKEQLSLQTWIAGSSVAFMIACGSAMGKWNWMETEVGIAY